MAARMCLAPFRLGLTATPERTDGQEHPYDELIGPIVYRRDITDLSGEYLASYETLRLEVELAPEERAAYEALRAEYLGFLRANGIRMSAPDGWQRFLMLSSQSDTGRRAFAAYRRQRALATAAPGKLDVLRAHPPRAPERASHRLHRGQRDGVPHLPALPRPRHHASDQDQRAEPRSSPRFRRHVSSAIVTSKVLNEGVDVPEASVGVVLSGSGSVREHVQRLGRILRKAEGKRALLYELVAAGTGEERTSEKRREHVAYR